MATVTIENAEVVRLIPNYGFEVCETFQLRNGDEAKRYFTVWTKETAKEGDRLSVQGELGVKLDEYTNKEGEKKQKISVNINDALIMQMEDAPF